MKSVAVVLIVFGLVATGIGVYFIRQSQVASTASKAYEVSKPLPKILDSDCDYVYLDTCPLKAKGDILITVPAEVEKTMKAHAAAQVLAYSEPVDPEVFSSLGKPSDLPVKDLYTVSEIIARISLSSNINYKLLIVLFATQGQKAWTGQTLASNPFGRKEMSFAEQMSAVAKHLRSNYPDGYRPPATSVKSGSKTYFFDAANMNLASKSLYTYLSQTTNEDVFLQLTTHQLSSQNSFRDTWNTLFPSDALRK